MRCRLCDAPVSRTFLDLGTAPPSNAYLDPAALDSPERYYPLRVKVCDVCHLVQTEDFAEADALFAADYGYFTATSKSAVAHAERFVAAAVDRFGLDERSMVVEVAANDGYLLQFVKARGIPCYGVEPTASTAAAARGRGIEIVEAFFGQALGEELAAKGPKADLMAANNVLAHVPDIRDFAAGFAALLAPRGVASFEFQHVLRMVERFQFDTVYHEHFSYLSLGTVTRLLAEVGLEVIDVEEVSTHGGSLRVWAAHAGAGLPHTEAPERIRAEETAAGMEGPAFYDAFQPRAEAVKNGFLAYLLDAKAKGRRVAAYGAAAKGNTLLNFAGVRGDLVAMVADRSPGKVGRFMPGSRIPIVSLETLLAARPDDIVVLPWNIAPELVAALEPARAWGARIVIAVPEMTEV